MRTIKLTHEEIDTIQTALQHICDLQMDIVSQNRTTLGEDSVYQILKDANKYSSTIEVFNGERDI